MKSNLNLQRRRLLGAVGALPLGMILPACDGSNEAGSPVINSVSQITDQTDELQTGAALAAPPGQWAVGGTEKILVDYPPDNLFNLDDACSQDLTVSAAPGPCYFESYTEEDISAGAEGLPMQLCLMLVDSECRPLSNYDVEIWHSDRNGLYSGDTSGVFDASGFAGDFCTEGNAEANSSTWFRGKMPTNNSGRVNFKSCFPGWYIGRSAHISYRIKDPGGSEVLVSQMCFSDELATEIFTTHELYRHRGDQPLPLAAGRDPVFGYPLERFIMDTRQNTDGSLLAWKVIRLG